MSKTKLLKEMGSSIGFLHILCSLSELQWGEKSWKRRIRVQKKSSRLFFLKEFSSVGPIFTA